MSADSELSSAETDELMQFFEFFSIPVTPELKAAAEGYKASQTESTQREFTKQLGKQIISSKHHALQDKIFDDIKSRIVEQLKMYEEEQKHVEP